MGSILGLDFGDRHVGVAISDPSQHVATPRETITYGAKVQLIETLKKIVFEDDVEALVIGLPLSLSGEDSEQTTRTRAFAEEIDSYLGIPVHLEDERLTTRQAERSLMDEPSLVLQAGDGRAAQMVLQAYLDRANNQGSARK